MNREFLEFLYERLEAYRTVKLQLEGSIADNETAISVHRQASIDAFNSIKEYETLINIYWEKHS